VQLYQKYTHTYTLRKWAFEVGLPWLHNTPAFVASLPAQALWKGRKGEQNTCSVCL